MKFTLTIDQGGNDDNGLDSLADYVATVARRLKAGELSGAVMAVNGNTVGRYKAEETSAGRRVMAWRMRDYGKSVDDIARELDVSPSTVFRYLKG